MTTTTRKLSRAQIDRLHAARLAKKATTEEEERLSQPPDAGDRLYYIRAAQRRMGNISRPTLYRLFAQGLRFVRIGKRRFLREKDILAFIEKQNGRK